MQHLRKDHPVTASKDFLPYEANASKRVRVVQNTGMRTRAENLQENLGVLAYMKRHNLDIGVQNGGKPTTSDQLLHEFHERTS